jgi:phospholipase/carboxylesterase
MSTDAYHHHFTAPSAPDAPLVVAFHGTGADETQFAGLVARMLPQAGLLAPRGDVSEHGAARFFRRRAEGVYDMDDLALRTRKMAGFVAAHRAAHPGRRVLGLGYSNGANILAAVAFAEPELFDAVALLHPLIPWTPAPQPGLAGRGVLITAGARDPICPLPQTQALIAWFGAQAAEVETLIHPGGHEIRPEEVTALDQFLTDRATPVSVP